MEIVLAIVSGLVGLVIGFFVWATIIGTLFATIPVKLDAKRLGLIKSINPLRIVAQFLIGAIIIVAMFIYAPIMFYASLLSLFKMLSGTTGLRREAIENLKVEYEGIDTSKMT